MNEEFNPLQYIASYHDLVQAFGANTAAGTQHYVTLGQAEGRVADAFDEQQYLTNYVELRNAFGGDGQRATLHYITNGYFEGRTDANLLPPGFDGLQYIASHDDLIAVFGADPVTGQQHYIDSGRNEGRVIDGFNEQQYLVNYPDLAAAFSGDGAAATLHYIRVGNSEGRSDQPLPTAVDDVFAVTEDSGTTRLHVLENDSNAFPTPGGTLTFVSVDVTNTIGSVGLTQAGRRILYDPGDAFDGLAEGQTALDVFTYTIENSVGARDTASVIVSVTGVNDAPVVLADTLGIDETAPTTMMNVDLEAQPSAAGSIDFVF